MKKQNSPVDEYIQNLTRQCDFLEKEVKKLSRQWKKLNINKSKQKSKELLGRSYQFSRELNHLTQ